MTLIYTSRITLNIIQLRLLISLLNQVRINVSFKIEKMKIDNVEKLGLLMLIANC